MPGTGQTNNHVKFTFLNPRLNHRDVYRRCSFESRKTKVYSHKWTFIRLNCRNESRKPYGIVKIFRLKQMSPRRSGLAIVRSVLNGFELVCVVAKQNKSVIPPYIIIYIFISIRQVSPLGAFFYGAKIIPTPEKAYFLLFTLQSYQYTIHTYNILVELEVQYWSRSIKWINPYLYSQRNKNSNFWNIISFTTKKTKET